MRDIVYVITCEKEVAYTSNDANKAIDKCIEYALDQHECDLEIWSGGHRIGTVDLNGKVQRIFSEEVTPQ